MKKWILIFGLLLLGVWGVKTRIERQRGWAKVKVGKTAIRVQVRDTVEGRKQGLSGWENLGQDEGMLFVFEYPARHSFWMKEMNFPLDFIFIEGKKVVEVIEMVPILTEVGKIVEVQSKAVADKVLEVNSGFVKREGIKIGDEIQYSDEIISN